VGRTIQSITKSGRNVPLDLILEKYRYLLKQGAILVDPNDAGETVRSLVYLDHSIQDARTTPSGQQGVVSRRMQYVEIDETGNAYSAGYAPYLDYRSLTASEQQLIAPIVKDLRLRQDLEDRATSYAISNLVPPHRQELKQRKEELIDKTLIAVKDRLTKEINYWDCRAIELHDRELQGKVNAKLNSAKARARADDLADRMQKRLVDLEQECKLSPLPPIVVGGALIIPIGLLHKLQGNSTTPNLFARETKRVELAAMSAVMVREKALGYEPKDVSDQKCGWDIESLITETGELRLIEVKGRIAGAETVTVTKNEVLAALNKPDRYFLALVEVSPLESVREIGSEYECQVRYVDRPFAKEPDFGVSSINYQWQELWNKGTELTNWEVESEK
jgi:hypothetical protein